MCGSCAGAPAVTGLRVTAVSPSSITIVWQVCGVLLN